MQPCAQAYMYAHLQGINSCQFLLDIPDLFLLALCSVSLGAIISLSRGDGRYGRGLLVYTCFRFHAT